MNTVAIIGAGQMGRGIAEVALLAGDRVVLIDQHPDSLQTAQVQISKNIARLASKEATIKPETLLQQLTTATDMAVIADANLCIEAVSEDEAIKKSVLKQTQEYLKPSAIVASNTSSISITRLATAVNTPDHFIGLHFMNPVPKMKLVEVIRGLQTNDETFAFGCDFIARLGKTVAVSEDFPAFIVNRVLIPMINEAVLALYEGVANVENIDKAMKLGANHPMGPLELADYIGLDTVLSILQVLYEGLADPKYRPCPLLNRYVEAGWLGKKTGRGFYDYSGDVPIPTR